LGNRLDIRAAAPRGPVSIEDNLQRFTFNVDTRRRSGVTRRRADYNINENHRLSNAFNYQKFTDSRHAENANNFDPAFPRAS
jgi:hypothetical protein